MDDETLVDVHFKWSDKYGECFDCGLPAAFVSPIRFGEKDLTSQANRLCAVCAANEAALGMPIKRLDEVLDQPEDTVEDKAARRAIRNILKILKAGHHTPHALIDAVLNDLEEEG